MADYSSKLNRGSNDSWIASFKVLDLEVRDGVVFSFSEGVLLPLGETDGLSTGTV